MVRVIGTVESPLVERVEEDRLEDVVARSVAKGEPVLIVADGAWGTWRRLRDRLYREGENWLLLEALDPLEASLAGLQLEHLIAARVTLAAYDYRGRAPLVLAGEKRVSRRELLRSLGTGVLAYRDTPLILDPSKCTSPGCPLCAPSCPSGAIRKAESGVEIEAEECTGCGLCLSYCPYHVLFKHSVSPQHLWDYVRSPPPDPSPGLLVYACRSTLHELLEGLRGWTPGHRVLIAPINCPGEATLELLLAPLLLGLTPVLYCPRAGSECGSQHVRRYAATVLEDYARITGAEPLVASDAGEVRSAKPVHERLLEPWEQPPVELAYAARLAAARLLAKLGRRDPVEITTPLQVIHLFDEERCTLCGACVAKCPTSALSLNRTTTHEEILYEPIRCIACHTCEAVCPENALKLRHAAHPAEPRVKTVHRDEVVHCIVCGKPVGPKKLIKATEERLRKAGAPEALIRELYLCDECKKKKALGLLQVERRQEQDTGNASNSP